MRTAAILPVKRFPIAKQRLGESVADSLRADLARAMVGDVLSALRECAAIETTIVVTCEPSVAAAARYIDAIVVEDSAEEGQSAAASLGLARALDEGFERALCVPGDCPTLDPEELDRLLDGGRTEVVIVPDRHGTGTNGLLLTPPDVMTPSFGPDSCERHGELAKAAGAHCLVEQVASLLLDIDTGEDLAVLRERLAGEQVRAPRTRAVLRRAKTGDGTADSAGATSGRDSRAA
jgi:2-phospho-L-lactate guanylyltransferase